MFDEMQKTVNVLCDYVKRGRFSRRSLLRIPQMLMIAERAGDALTDSENKEVLEKMDSELSNVIVEFERAINVETLRKVRKARKHSSSQYSAGPFSTALCRANASTGAA